MRDLEGRFAIVTGAAGGLGLEYAGALAEAGAGVCLADLQADKVREAASALAGRGYNTIGLAYDQSDPESVHQMAAAAHDHFGKVDILINNASLFATLERRPLLEVPVEEWNKVISVNLNGVFYCCLSVMPGMIEAGYGKIVNISSSAIFSAKNLLGHYDAAKAGVVGLTRALAREYGNSGIRVNAVSPGATDSGRGPASTEYLQSKVGIRSISRVQQPQDLTGAVLFFSSPDSDFITGQNLIVDGGGEFQ